MHWQPADCSRASCVGAIVALACTVLAPGMAHAEAIEPAVLDYAVAPNAEACPDAGAFGDAVTARLGYDPFSASAGRRVIARVEHAGSAYRGSVDLRDARGALLGSKTLEARKCDDLVSAMSFAVSMALDPRRTLRGPPAPAPVPAPMSVPANAPAAVSLPDPLPDASPEAERASTGRPPIRPHVFVGGAVATLGPIAGFTEVLIGGAGLRYGAASLDVEGRFYAPSSVSAGAGQVRTSTLGVAVLPCAHVDPFFVCANFFLGALQGAAETIEAPAQATTLFSQAGLRLGAAIPISGVGLEPYVDALATLTRTQVTFRGTPVWSTSAAGVNGGIRLVLHFQ